MYAKRTEGRLVHDDEVKVEYQSPQLNPLLFPIKVRFQAVVEKVYLNQIFGI